MIEVFHSDANIPFCSEMFTRLVIVGKISSMHCFNSLVGNASSLHDFDFILKMIFLTSVCTHIYTQISKHLM